MAEIDVRATDELGSNSNPDPDGDNLTATDLGFFDPDELGNDIPFYLRHLNQFESAATGTGNFSPFLRINGETTIRGFNTAENISNSGQTAAGIDHVNPDTNAIRLGDIPIIYLDQTDDGINNPTAFYQINLDINENTNKEVSLEELQFFTSSSAATLANYRIDNGDALAFSAADGFTLRFDLDATADNKLILRDDGSGQGSSDYIFYIPVAVFGNATPNDFFTLYSQFGPTPADDAGFAEWNTVPSTRITGVKFNDHDGDSVRDAGDEGLAGFTMYIDSNNNDLLDAGEMTAETGADGSFTFFSLIAGEVYTIREVLSVADLANPAQTQYLPDIDGNNIPDTRVWDQTTGDASGDQLVGTGGVYTTLVGNRELLPGINLEKEIPSITGGLGTNGLTGADGAGDIINYTISVTNTGDVNLTNVVVTDANADTLVRVADVSGDNDAILEVGEIWAYSATHVVTQTEIDTRGGGDNDIDNTAFVTANYTNGQVSDSDTEDAPVLYLPSLNITKEASVPGGTADAAGEKISYVITVANTGNTTLTEVEVTDPYADLGSIVRGADVVGDGDDLLEVGETWGYTAAHTVTQAEIDTNGGGDGKLENIATADSKETGPDMDDATVPVDRRPSLNIVKDASVPGGTADAAGEKISYVITVANTGNTTLTEVEVTDPYADLGSIVRGADVVGDGDDLLEVGETWGYTAAHTVTQAEIDTNGGGDGKLENIATADSKETGPDMDDATVPVEQRKTVDLEKYVSVDGVDYVDADYDLGDPLPYGPQNVNINAPVDFRITVKNTGNVSLTDVVIRDIDTSAIGSSDTILFQNGALTAAADALGASLAGDTDDDGILDVGETWTIEYTTAFDPGQHLNTGYVTTLQGAMDNDNAAYFSLVNDGPGVRTPGFWSNLGYTFWDGIADNEPKQAGTPGFADGELLYGIDTNGDGVAGGQGDKVGLLVGDYDHDGFTDAGEDTIFIGLDDAHKLINASNKQMSDGVYKLGRDVVATWLNSLAGNNIGESTVPDAPKHYLDDAVDWLQQFAGISDVNPATPDMFKFGAPVKSNSANWNSPVGGSDHSASQMHNALDHYNNDGRTEDGGTPYAHDTDDAAFMAAITTVQNMGLISGGTNDDYSLTSTQHALIM
jgi:hypothetical protein